MEQKIFSIRDSKADYYTTPFFVKTMGEAERMFKDIIRDEKSQLNKHPEDFDLYYMGLYDDNTGKWTCLDILQHMHKAIEFVETNT